MEVEEEVHRQPQPSTQPHLMGVCMEYHPQCYVLVECPAQLELGGYDSVIWHVVLEACASDTR